MRWRLIVLTAGIDELGAASGQRVPIEAPRLELGGFQFQFRMVSTAKEIAAVIQMGILGVDDMHRQRHSPRTPRGKELGTVSGLSHIGFASSHCRFTSPISSFISAS